MRVEPIEPIKFGITVKQSKKYIYYPNCWNEITEGKFKDYSFKIYNNFINGQKSSTLIILKKAEKWIKSKLKYMFDGERKTLWSYSNDRMV